MAAIKGPWRASSAATNESLLIGEIVCHFETGETAHSSSGGYKSWMSTVTPRHVASMRIQMVLSTVGTGPLSIKDLHLSTIQ